jgi:hypothetical protein
VIITIRAQRILQAEQADKQEPDIVLLRRPLLAWPEFCTRHAQHAQALIGHFGSDFPN